MENDLRHAKDSCSDLKARAAKLSTCAIAMLAAGLLACATSLVAQAPVRPSGTVIIPDSSVVREGGAEVMAHTNTQIFVPAGQSQPFSVNGLPNGETPASIACVYQVAPGPYPTGCKKSGSGAASNLPTGGSGVIVLVDAYDAPNIVGDLTAFSQQFGLPVPTASNFYKYKVGNPAANLGWAEEETLDVEWAHAMAPHATIILVEATTSSLTNLMTAEDWATSMVANNGFLTGIFPCGGSPWFAFSCYGQISNSWGAPEFGGESSYDSHFYTDDWFQCQPGGFCTFPGGPVTYFAAAGDKPGVSYPSAAPSIISAGGTSINRDANGNFIAESAWNQTGGGISAFEPLPPYQAALSHNQFGGALQARTTPDLACVADPYTGVDVYFSYPNYGAGWLVFGGTSVCSPVLAGIVNSAGNFINETSLYNEHFLLYSEFQGIVSYSTEFSDVKAGTCGTGGKYYAGVSYDFCTGIGSPKTLIGK